MPSIGHHHRLEIIKQVDFGFYLDAEGLGEVLLPNRVAPENCEVGDWLDVFIYLDSEDRPVATTHKPLAEVGQFAYLKVAACTKVGAFLEWGLDKQLLVPFAEQRKRMEEGRSYIVYVYVDKRDKRIVASSKVEKFIDDHAAHPFRPRDEVNILIANSTDLGYKAIIEDSCWGVLYKNEVFKRLSYGQRCKAFVKRVRPDGKIDLSLTGGKQTQDKDCETLLDHLKQHGGQTHLHDKSDPKEISKTLHMSKASFKRAVGRLLKLGKIELIEQGIKLVKAD